MVRSESRRAFFTSLLWLALASTSLLIRALACGAEAGGKTTAEMIVRRPDLSPLADHAIEVSEHTDPPFPDNTAWKWSGKTGPDGRLSVPRFAGVHQFHIAVGGVGFGVTGQFKLEEGKAVAVTLPPLALFGAVRGEVRQDLFKPGIMFIRRIQSS